jgi:hypothetical protein
MRKDAISQQAIEAAYLIYAERGHEIQDYSHAPTDYARGTVEEPEVNSVINQRFGELLPANVSNGERYEDMEAMAHDLNMQIDEQQNKMRICRQRGNFQELQKCMKEMQSLIKRKEALDAKMSVAAPGGNAGQKQMDDYNRTYDQETSYSEKMSTIATRMAELEAKMMEFAEQVDE